MATSKLVLKVQEEIICKHCCSKYQMTPEFADRFERIFSSRLSPLCPNCIDKLHKICPAQMEWAQATYGSSSRSIPTLIPNQMENNK